MDVIQDKLYEKDIANNATALKRDVKTHIQTLQNISEQITEITGQEIAEIEGIIEKVATTLKTEESKAKEQMLKSVLANTEDESNKIQTMVTQIKTLQRDRARMERLIKLKMECIKTPS